MKRTTIVLPEELAILVTREARRKATSISEVVRQALTAHFGLSHGKQRRIPFAAVGRSGERHNARDMEDILAREWGGARRR